MKIKMAWAIQSFFLCFLFNLAFAAVIFFMADRILEALNEWVSPLIGTGRACPAGGFTHGAWRLRDFCRSDTRIPDAPCLPLWLSAFTLLLWFFLFLAGGRQIRRASSSAQGGVQESVESKGEGEEAR